MNKLRYLLAGLLICTAALAQTTSQYIYQLPNALTPVGTEIVPGAQLGTSGSYSPAASCSGGYCGVGITLNQIKTFVGSSSGGGLTSIGLTGSGILSFTNSPLTSNGTIGTVWTGTQGGVPWFSSSASLASSAVLTANRVLVGGGTGAPPAALGSAGTVTTLLHGNASGVPSFGAVNLTTDVAGLLPGANGGTGANNGTAVLTYNQNSSFISNDGVIAPAHLQGNEQSTNYTFALADCNAGDVLHYGSGAGSAAIWILNAHATTAFPLGCTIVLDNEAGGGTITITPAAGVGLSWNSGVGTWQNGTTNRTLQAAGTATLHQIFQDSWVITGSASLQ